MAINMGFGWRPINSPPGSRRAVPGLVGSGLQACRIGPRRIQAPSKPSWAWADPGSRQSVASLDLCEPEMVRLERGRRQVRCGSFRAWIPRGPRRSQTWRDVHGPPAQTRIYSHGPPFGLYTCICPPGPITPIIGIPGSRRRGCPGTGPEGVASLGAPQARALDCRASGRHCR